MGRKHWEPPPEPKTATSSVEILYGVVLSLFPVLVAAKVFPKVKSTLFALEHLMNLQYSKLPKEILSQIIVELQYGLEVILEEAAFQMFETALCCPTGTVKNAREDEDEDEYEDESEDEVDEVGWPVEHTRTDTEDWRTIISGNCKACKAAWKNTKDSSISTQEITRLLAHYNLIHSVSLDSSVERSFVAISIPMRGSATCSVTEKREVDECSDHRCEYASEPDSDSEDSTAAACYIDPRGLNLALADLYIRQIYDFKLVLSDSVSTTSAAGNSRFTAIVDQWEQYRWRGNEQLQPKFIAWSTASID